MDTAWEIYDENNPNHNNLELYEVVEWSNINDSNGRHPNSVQIGTIVDDANRRDFTVNALYFNLASMSLIDPTGQGIDDIRERILRFVGKPEDRIREDYLRVWRAFRFSKTKGLRLNPATEKALGRMFAEAYAGSDPQRVLQEVRKMI